MYRFHTVKIPDVFIGCFKRIQYVHRYAPQSCSGLYATQFKTGLGLRDITYTGPDVWNNVLSVGINPDASEYVLKVSQNFS